MPTPHTIPEQQPVSRHEPNTSAWQFPSVVGAGVVEVVVVTGALHLNARKLQSPEQH